MFARPSQWALLLHIHKTFSLIRAVLADARVHWIPKSLFLSCIGAMLLVLLGGNIQTTRWASCHDDVSDSSRTPG